MVDMLQIRDISQELGDPLIGWNRVLNHRPSSY